MSIDAAKPKSTVMGGMRMVLMPNGLWGPLTSGVSECTNATCSKGHKPFDHIEVLAMMPPSIKYLFPIDWQGGTYLVHRDVLRSCVMDMHMGERDKA